MADTNQQEEEPQAKSLKEHILTNKSDIALYLSRIFTILFTIFYIIPIIGNSQKSYYRVLLANAITNAIRLNQRLPSFQISKEFFMKLIQEDSCHYLFYSFIFMSVKPVLYIIIPVFLFAILHAASYSLKLLDILGQNSWWGARFLISIIEFQARNILRLTALTEIILMPLCVIFYFTGTGGLFTPFVYYQFIILRYTSKRNPHTKLLFSEIRKATEVIARNPSLPAFIRNGLLRGIEFISRLAPSQQVAPVS